MDLLATGLGSILKLLKRASHLLNFDRTEENDRHHRDPDAEEHEWQPEDDQPVPGERPGAEQKPERPDLEDQAGE